MVRASRTHIDLHTPPALINLGNRLADSTDKCAPPAFDHERIKRIRDVFSSSVRQLLRVLFVDSESPTSQTTSRIGKRLCKSLDHADNRASSVPGISLESLSKRTSMY